MKCVICERRPARDGAYCANCTAEVEAEARRRQAAKPAKFFTYRGHVVGLVPNGNGTLKAILLNRSPEVLPKSKTLDLNHYIEGFTRAQIKQFKACVLQLAYV